MITLTDTERSMIAWMSPQEAPLWVRTRSGAIVHLRPEDDGMPILHLFDIYDGITTPARYWSAHKMLRNVLAKDRAPVKEALVQMNVAGRPAMIVWERRQRVQAGGQPYGPQVWVPAGHRIVTEQELADSRQAPS